MASLELAKLPSSKFWPENAEEEVREKTHSFCAPVQNSNKVNLVNLEYLQILRYWDDDFGLHPGSPLWHGASKMMIRNVPARCAQAEIEDMISSVMPDFKLQMPRASDRKCKGYAFVDSLLN